MLVSPRGNEIAVSPKHGRNINGVTMKRRKAFSRA